MVKFINNLKLKYSHINIQILFEDAVSLKNDLNIIFYY